MTSEYRARPSLWERPFPAASRSPPWVLMSSSPPNIRAPLEAPPARQFLHGVLAAAGWVLFVWWWWIVLQDVTPSQVRFTSWFLLISLVIIASVTALWASHNQRIHQAKGARQGLPEVREDFSRDVLGRPVEYPTSLEECQTAAIIIVRLEEGRKIYQAAAAKDRTAGGKGA